MQREIKRIHVVQAGLVLGILYAGMGLLIGLFYGLFILLVGVAGASSASGSGSGSGSGAMELLAIFGGMGLFAVILIPLFYGTLGFISGMIGALIYNLTAKVVGGFKVDIVDISMAQHQIEAGQAAISTDSMPPAQG